MNKQRREELSKIYSELEGLQARIEAVRDEEQETYDNMPESLQGSERGEQSQAAIDELENATSSLTDVLSNIETAKE